MLYRCLNVLMCCCLLSNHLLAVLTQAPSKFWYCFPDRFRESLCGSFAIELSTTQYRFVTRVPSHGVLSFSLYAQVAPRPVPYCQCKFWGSIKRNRGKQIIIVERGAGVQFFGRAHDLAVIMCVGTTYRSFYSESSGARHGEYFVAKNLVHCGGKNRLFLLLRFLSIAGWCGR